jgi:hypothetical protein
LRFKQLSQPAKIIRPAVTDEADQRWGSLNAAMRYEPTDAPQETRSCSINSSARAMSIGDTSMPSAIASYILEKWVLFELSLT